MSQVSGRNSLLTEKLIHLLQHQQINLCLESNSQTKETVKEKHGDNKNKFDKVFSNFPFLKTLKFAGTQHFKCLLSNLFRSALSCVKMFR